MTKLINILLEAVLTEPQANDIIDAGKVVSLYYNKKWVKNVLPISLDTVDGQKALVADVKNEQGKIERKKFKLSDVNNINRTSQRTSLDEPEKGKSGGKKPPISKPPTTSSDPIIDDINNNRAITIYYIGDKQNKPGWRTILPVAYGSHSSKTYGDKDYIRAWQWKGDTVRGIPKWKLFRVDRVKNWNRVSTQIIKDAPDPRYNPKGDKWMDKIYAFAKFGVDESVRKELKESLSNLVKNIIKS